MTWPGGGVCLRSCLTCMCMRVYAIIKVNSVSNVLSGLNREVVFWEVTSVSIVGTVLSGLNRDL